MTSHPEDKIEEERFREWTTTRLTKTPKMTNHGHTSFPRNLHDWFFFEIRSLTREIFQLLISDFLNFAHRQKELLEIELSITTSWIGNIEYHIVKEQKNDSVWTLNREILNFRFLSLNDERSNRNMDLNWTIHVEMNHSYYHLEMMMIMKNLTFENALTNILYQKELRKVCRR